MRKSKKDKDVNLEVKSLKVRKLLCSWCGECSGVAMTDRRTKHKDGSALAEDENIYDQEPCSTCKEAMIQGVTVVEVDAARERTGRWVVIKESAARNIFREHAFRGDGTVHPKIAVDVEVFDSLFNGD